MTFKCELCANELVSKEDFESRNWDWFTGYLERTVHFCGIHKDSKERNNLLKLSRKVPECFIEENRKNNRHKPHCVSI